MNTSQGEVVIAPCGAIANSMFNGHHFFLVLWRFDRVLSFKQLENFCYCCFFQRFYWAVSCRCWLRQLNRVCNLQIPSRFILLAEMIVSLCLGLMRVLHGKSIKSTSSRILLATVYKKLSRLKDFWTVIVWRPIC